MVHVTSPDFYGTLYSSVHVLDDDIGGINRLKQRRGITVDISGRAMITLYPLRPSHR